MVGRTIIEFSWPVNKELMNCVRFQGEKALYTINLKGTCDLVGVHLVVAPFNPLF